MNTCRVLVCAFVFCFVASEAFADGDYYEKKYDDVIVPAYGKLIGSGKKNIILPTQQNVITICADLLRDALPEIPKKIRPEVKKLAYELQEYDGHKDEYLIDETQGIIKEIDQGYIREECDFSAHLREALYVIYYVIQFYVPKYDYKYD